MPVSLLRMAFFFWNSRLESSGFRILQKFLQASGRNLKVLFVFQNQQHSTSGVMMKMTEMECHIHQPIQVDDDFSFLYYRHV